MNVAVVFTGVSPSFSSILDGSAAVRIFGKPRPKRVSNMRIMGLVAHIEKELASLNLPHSSLVRKQLPIGLNPFCGQMSALQR